VCDCHVAKFLSYDWAQDSVSITGSSSLIFLEAGIVAQQDVCFGRWRYRLAGGYETSHGLNQGNPSFGASMTHHPLTQPHVGQCCAIDTP
jgi:hypothetical protein